MATITVKYVGLIGTRDQVSVSDTLTIDGLIAAIAADEGLPTEYYTVSLLNNPSVTDITYGDSSATIASLGFVNNSVALCTTNQAGTKQERQIQKLEIAQLKRQAGGDTSAIYYRGGNVYDLSSLPDTYNGNDILPDDNPNTGGLIVGRPWIGVAALAAPASIAEALPANTLVALESWYDGSDGQYFVPNNPTDGQTFTQWTDKSNFAHNANPIGGATTRASYQTNELNTLSVVRFDGNDGLDINPYASLASAPALTVFVVMKMTATAGNPRVFSTNSGLTEMYYDSTAAKFVVEAAGGVGTSTVANNSAAFHIHTFAYDGSQTTNAASLKYRYDKTDITLSFTGTVGDTLSASNTRFYIGNNNGANFFTGDIAEFLIFTHVLTTVEIQNVENYLSNKWGL